MTREFEMEADLIKVKQTVPVPPHGTCTITAYMTQKFAEDRDKRVVEDYLNHTVTDFLTREGVVIDADL